MTEASQKFRLVGSDPSEQAKRLFISQVQQREREGERERERGMEGGRETERERLCVFLLGLEPPQCFSLKVCCLCDCPSAASAG